MIPNCVSQNYSIHKIKQMSEEKFKSVEEDDGYIPT